MARHYEMITRPAWDEKTLVKTTCDLCGAEAKRGLWDSSAWDSYAVNDVEIEVTMRHEEGDRWPNGESSIEACQVDLCPDCFKNKLVPWLQSQGADIKYEDKSV